MRIVLLTILYPDAVKSLYSRNRVLGSLSYKEQKKEVDNYVSLWASGWEETLAEKSFEVFTIPVNVNRLQEKWAEENNLPQSDLHETAFRQIKKFRPEILVYDYFDIPLISKIKEEIKSIKLIIGYTGSVVVDYEILKYTDVVISCAPETVKKLSGKGINSVHLHHAFNPRLLQFLNILQDKKDFIFLGQILRGENLHYYREKLLEELVKNLNLIIYSPTYNYGPKQILLRLIKKTASFLLYPMLRTQFLSKFTRENLYLKEIIRFSKAPVFPFSLSLKKKMKPPLYGMDMYNKIANSLLVLNTHADSSPEYASNMRLFETTGVGTCLLTDWKKNINELFEDGKEIVTYKSTDECIEKGKWLLDNPGECKEIGKAAQKRVLKEHTYSARIENFLEIIEKNLK